MALVALGPLAGQTFKELPAALVPVLANLDDSYRKLRELDEPAPTDYARSLIDDTLNRRQRRYKSEGLQLRQALGAVRLGAVSGLVRCVWAGRGAVDTALAGELPSEARNFLETFLLVLDLLDAVALASESEPVAAVEPPICHRRAQGRPRVCAHSRRHLVTSAATTGDPDSPSRVPIGVTPDSFFTQSRGPD